MTQTHEQNLAPCRFPGCGLVGCIYGPHEQWARENPEVNRPASHGLKRNEPLKDFVQEIADEGCAYGDNCPPNAGTRHGDCMPCKARRALLSEVDAQRAPVAGGVTEQEGFLLSTIESETGVMSLESWRDHARALAGCFRTRLSGSLQGEAGEGPSQGELPTLIGMGYQDLQREFGVNFFNASNLHGWIGRTIRAIRRENLVAAPVAPREGETPIKFSTNYKDASNAQLAELLMSVGVSTDGEYHALKEASQRLAAQREGKA